MDRPTGNYNHERLIALEDSHKVLIYDLQRAVDLFACGEALTEFRCADFSDDLKKAMQIRKEAGLE